MEELILFALLVVIIIVAAIAYSRGRSDEKDKWLEYWHKVNIQHKREQELNMPLSNLPKPKSTIT